MLIKVLIQSYWGFLYYFLKDQSGDEAISTALQRQSQRNKSKISVEEKLYLNNIYVVKIKI